MLTYDDEIHQYYWNGVKIPSLSEMLRMTGWGREFTYVSEPVLAAARERGDQFHKAVYAYLSGDPEFSRFLSLESEPYFDSFLKVEAELELSEDGVGELPIGGWCGYGTTPDRLEEGQKRLLEFKTTSKLHPQVWIQLAGQAYAVRLLGKEIRTRQVLRLLKTGKRGILTTDPEPDRTWSLWANELDKLDWKKEKKWS